MRKIILNVAVSLDGFIEGPNGEYDWCFTDQDYGMTAFIQSVDAVFLGRKSYELVINTGGDYLGNSKQYVFSNTLNSLDNKNVTIINGDIAAAVQNIKSQEGKDIWLFGGASLVSSFMQHHLVDELMLAVHPILLGSGKPLFEGLKERTALTLTDTKTYNTCLVQLFYAL